MYLHVCILVICFKKASNSNQASLVLGKKQPLYAGLDYIEDAVYPADSYDVEELERYIMYIYISSFNFLLYLL